MKRNWISLKWNNRFDQKVGHPKCLVNPNYEVNITANVIFYGIERTE